MAEPAWMDPNKVKWITIHCAATPEGRDNKAAEISAWDIEKFGQVSYHHVIELDGNDVKTLRYNQRGAHVGKNNTGNIGVCYIGGVDKQMRAKDTRTDAQKIALKKRVLELKKLYPNAVVRGHREWPGVNKACPSFDVAAWLKAEGIR